MSFDAFLVGFLHAQSESLVDLELLADGTYTGEPILAQLRHVRILRVCLLDLEMAAALVRGRPVTHMQVSLLLRLYHANNVLTRGFDLGHNCRAT